MPKALFVTAIIYIILRSTHVINKLSGGVKQKEKAC